MGLGFIGAGNDLKPAANTTVKECLSVCSDSAACKAVSFMQSHADENKTDAMVRHCHFLTFDCMCHCLSFPFHCLFTAFR